MKYSKQDFENLVRAVWDFSPKYVSPHVLAELSNLSNKLPAKDKPAYYETISPLLADQLEVLVPKEDIIDKGEFPKIGFADTSILNICAERGCVLFTADWALTQILRHKGLGVINYTEFMGLNWLSE
jgi:rRNA-processing protein FCF1